MSVPVDPPIGAMIISCSASLDQPVRISACVEFDDVGGLIC